MIKIIEEGILPEDKIYVHVCENCNTKFTFQQSDCNIGITDRMYYIYCPFCKYGYGKSSFGEFIEVKDGDIL